MRCYASGSCCAIFWVVVVGLLSVSGLCLACLGCVGRSLFGALSHPCVYFSLHFFLLGAHLRKLCGAFFSDVVVVLVPIAFDVVVLWVEVAEFGGVVIADGIGVVVVVAQGLLLPVGVFLLLGLIWLQHEGSSDASASTTSCCVIR